MSFFSWEKVTASLLVQLLLFRLLFSTCPYLFKNVLNLVYEPTDWVDAISCSRKRSGELRICLDPKSLNKFIKRTYYKTLTFEEIFHKLAGAKHFIKLDAKDEYWAIHLDESSLLTCFNIPFGRYKYLRCPFGLKASQDILQQKMDQVVEDCKGAIGISDDICIYGRTTTEYVCLFVFLFNGISAFVGYLMPKLFS